VFERVSLGGSELDPSLLKMKNKNLPSISIHPLSIELMVLLK